MTKQKQKNFGKQQTKTHIPPFQLNNIAHTKPLLRLLLRLVRFSSSVYQVVHLMNPDQLVEKMLDQLSKKFKVSCTVAYVNDSFEVDRSFKVGEVFSQNEIITIQCEEFPEEVLNAKEIKIEVSTENKKRDEKYEAKLQTVIQKIKVNAGTSSSNSDSQSVVKQLSVKSSSELSSMQQNGIVRVPPQNIKSKSSSSFSDKSEPPVGKKPRVSITNQEIVADVNSSEHDNVSNEEFEQTYQPKDAQISVDDISDQPSVKIDNLPASTQHIRSERSSSIMSAQPKVAIPVLKAYESLNSSNDDDQEEVGEFKEFLQIKQRDEMKLESSSLSDSDEQNSFKVGTVFVKQGLGQVVSGKVQALSVKPKQQTESKRKPQLISQPITNQKPAGKVEKTEKKFPNLF